MHGMRGLHKRLSRQVFPGAWGALLQSRQPDIFCMVLYPRVRDLLGIQPSGRLFLRRPRRLTGLLPAD